MLNVTGLLHKGDLLLTWRRDEVQDGSRFQKDDKVMFAIPIAVPFSRDFYHRMAPNQVGCRA